jgi:hypothetical protein
MKSESLLILDPPYVMARRLSDTEPELGAVALLDAVPHRPSTNEVRGQMDVAPWCPLCILAGEESGMRSTRRLSRACVVFGLGEDGGAAILRAVAARPRPTPSALVEWITRRTRLPSLARTLSDLFTRPVMCRSEVAFLPYQVRDQLRLLGEWSAADWQRGAALAELAADRTSMKRTLAAADSRASELRTWMVELLGVTLADFERKVGWEWVLEGALRRSGFVEHRTKGIRPLRPQRAVVPSVEAWGEVRVEAAFERRRATA